MVGYPIAFDWVPRLHHVLGVAGVTSKTFTGARSEWHQEPDGGTMLMGQPCLVGRRLAACTENLASL